MTTDSFNQAIRDQIVADIRRLEDLQRRMYRASDWRADALERAGDLAMAGRWSESREMARRAREE